MQQLLFNIKGYAVIIVTLAAVYACFFLFARNRGGDITGMVFKKAASNELDEAETGSTTVTSQIRDRLILLARPIFGVGVLFFSFTAFLAATNHGFDDDSLPVVMILGLLFCACVLLALLLIFKIDKPKTEEPSYGPKTEEPSYGPKTEEPTYGPKTEEPTCGPIFLARRPGGGGSNQALRVVIW